MRVPFLPTLIRAMESAVPVPKDQSDYDEDVFNAIVASPVLTEEDLDLILFHHKKIPRHQDKKRKEMNRDLLVRSSIVVCSAFVLANVSMPKWLRSVVYVVPCGIFLDTLKRRFQRPKRRRLDMTKQYLKLLDDLQMLMKKCLRFIQEMEIASLGYTLACGSSMVSHLQRIQQSRTGKCFDLRYSVLNSCLTIITAHREASLKLLQYSCNETKLNAPLCQIPLDELGPCFGKDCSFEDICSSSDDLCLQFLRDTTLFMQLQQSEYLKLFVLSQHKSTEESLFLLMEELSSICENQLKNLENVHQIQLNVSKPQLDDGRERKSMKGQSVGYQAIHSIQVHLRAALEIAVQSGAGFVGGEDTSNISDALLPQLQVHLEASKQCVIEALRCLKMEGEAAPSKQDEHKPPPEIVNVPTQSVIDSSLLEKNDSYSEDQIFEAIVEESESGDDQDVSSITEPEEMRRKRIEETQHVMKELKSVLHVKASAEERELRKSKLFPQYIPKKITHENMKIFSDTVEESSSGDAPNIKDTTSTDGSDKKKYSADGERHEILPVLRRPKIPRPNRRPRTHFTRDESDGNAAEGNSDDECKSEHLLTGSLGFSSSLAHQAVLAAQAKSGMPGWRMVEEATFGDSDSDS